MTSIDPKLYAREPIGFHGTIPLFSRQNDYTENYEKISADHLEAMLATGANPFIEEDLWREIEESTAALIARYAQPGASILDIGVGLGRVLSRFPQLRRHGVDISLGYLERAQAEGIEVAYALVGELPYREGSFDVIMCTDVLEHVFDLYGSCANILAALKPGGVLIVRVPYREDLTQYLDTPYKFVHVRNFDEPSLRLLFGTIFGAEIVEVSKAGYLAAPSRRIGHLVPNPIVLRFLGLLRRVSRRAFRRLLERWYLPVEVNIVVRKRA